MLKTTSRAIQQPEMDLETLSEFEVTSPNECEAILKNLQSHGALVSLCSVDNPKELIVTQLLEVEANSGRLVFELAQFDEHTNFIEQHRAAVVVALEEKIKLQFTITGIALGQSDQSPVLLAEMPRSIYRIQRREAFRVRPLAAHPATCLIPLTSRRFQGIASEASSSAPRLFDALVLDVSVSGLSIELSLTEHQFQLGDFLEECFLHLPGQTAFPCTLKICYVGVMQMSSLGYRIGAHFENLPADCERAIQRYVNAVEISRKSVKPASP
jgi:flagellar brake protein